MLLLIAHICVFLIFICHAASKSYAAMYERVEMFEIYNLAYLVDGPGQRVITRQLDPTNKVDKKATTVINNGYKGADGGKMDWKEWNYAISNLKGEPEIPDYYDTSKWDVNTPEGLRALTKEMWSSPIDNMIKIQYATCIFDSKSTLPSFDQFQMSLADFIVRVRNTVGGMDEDTRNKAKPILERLRIMTEDASYIRGSEFRQNKYLGEDLRQAFPGINVQTTTATNPAKPEQKWEVVDVQKTLADPQSRTAIQAALPQVGDWRQAFLNRIDLYGHTVYSGEKAWTHRSVLNIAEYLHRSVTDAIDACGA